MIIKPNPPLASEGLGTKKDDSGSRPYSPPRPPSKPDVIHAELLGDSTCTADGLTSCGTSPVLHLCRLMLAAGHDPTLPLRVYRGHHLALACCQHRPGRSLRGE